MKNEITIDGQTYVLKSIKKEKVKCEDRFNTKEEAQIHKMIQKAGYGFHEELDCLSEIEILEKDKVAVMDAANVSLIFAISNRAKLILRRYINHDTEMKIPELKYDDLPNKKEIEAMYSSECLESLLNFFKIFDKMTKEGNVKIKIKPDFPMTIYNTDFGFIVAPRVEGD